MAIDLKNHKVGRKPLLTDKVADDIYMYVSQGNYISTACQAAGIVYDTFLHWVERAKRYDEFLTNSNIPDDIDISDLPDNDTCDLIYFKLCHRLKTAEALAEAHHVANLNKASDAGPQFWAASATYLSRKYPDRWADRQAVDINVAATQELLQQCVKALRTPDAETKQIQESQ